MTATCQQERWYKLPSGKQDYVRCGNPATEREHVVGVAGMGFRIIEWLCANHDDNTKPHTVENTQ